MTATLSPRAGRRAAVEGADLSADGIHRDPGAHDPIASGGFAQRLVDKVSTALAGRKTSRRSFLTKTAVVGSALAVSPFDFILKPGTAYGYTCGTCSDGWTAFCCTVNNGRNSCPPGSFIAGWWKADNAAYCCGKARYIIDCNASCPTQCSCRCANGAGGCDTRRTCCNQFRYGQCHQEISCYGPVVCRVATCTVPWRYDPSCTTASATDNRTREHGAPCIGTDCGPPPQSAIDQKYAALGGSRGFLGSPTQAEAAVGDGRGRRRRYRGGNIYSTAQTGAHEVHGGILTEYDRRGGPTGLLRYPTADTRTSADGRTRYSNFELGRIYYFRNDGHTVTIPAEFYLKHESVGGVSGVLGYPTILPRTSHDGRSRYVNFENGRIYLRDGQTTAIFGSIFRYHESIRGVYGPLGYPLIDLIPIGDGRGSTQWFEKGVLWHSRTTGAQGLWGQVYDRFMANGHVRGYLRYPTSSVRNVGDGKGTYATFERGRIYASPNRGGFEVHGAVLDLYLAQGGPTGSLGYPTTEFDPPGTPGARVQSFEGGRIRYANGRATLA